MSWENIILLCTVFLLVILIGGVRIVPAKQVWVVEFMGAFHAVWQTGVHFLVPLLMRVAQKLPHPSAELHVHIQPPPGSLQSGDESLVQVTLYYQIVNPKHYAYSVRPGEALILLAQTALKSVSRELEPESIAAHPEEAGVSMCEMLRPAVQELGIQINHVDVISMEERNG